MVLIPLDLILPIINLHYTYVVNSSERLILYTIEPNWSFYVNG